MEQPEYRVHKHHRRISSTGGSRAWTEEEEAYLLRTRINKMPYKHIAAHLKKTELACRLHYHQMSYGNNSRRRSASISSTRSLNLIAATGEVSENAYRTQLSPVVSPSSSPELGSRLRAASDNISMQAHRAHVPILPKPDHAGSHDPDSPRASSTDCYKREEQSDINFPRLHSIYETHCQSFWSKIAAEYSRDAREVSAKVVEEAITRNLSQTRPQLPPTPKLSPVASPEPQQPDCGFSVLSVCAAESTRRSLAERCSVSALLTVEKELTTA
ncbi:hypothetical protein UA08_08362 [Talaromyces atroroseus]|uniref:Myb-like domain-containing protein n=1 Tax=Talaromyces atroroseus TaxID=1441469 RepID=A0A225APY0_TALAT|nr:hypothetical protein UA08_08362 [Talaromyces atroroseus]OKL56485.1 hypothetical protein UA08_08362 [Talaromyces atroroseus]